MGLASETRRLLVGPMRIELRIEGGLAHFPGLAKPLVLRTEDLSSADRAEIERLAAAARLFERPEEAGGPGRVAPDARRYRLEVEEEGRRRALVIDDPIADPALAAL